MDQSLRNKDQLDMLVKFVVSLESRILELESDVYDMRRENTETRRRLSDLESSKRMIPF